MNRKCFSQAQTELCVIYIYMGSGSSSMEPPCCTATVSQKGQTSTECLPRFMFLPTAV